MKSIKYLLHHASILILALFVSHPQVSAQAKYFDDLIIEKLASNEGMVVADVGAGSGKLSAKMARIVGLKGHVYAIEIDEDSIKEIESLMEEQGIENMTTIHKEEEDAVLPVKVDLILLSFVYHHLSNPDKFMTNLLKYLNPGGRLAIVASDINSFSPEDANKKDRDPCIGDPDETIKAIENNGFQFEKKEEIVQLDTVEYILFFKNRTTLTNL